VLRAEEINRTSDPAPQNQEHVVFQDTMRQAMLNDELQAVVTASKVSDRDRLRTLPRLFPNIYLIVETRIYDFAAALIDGYNGGYWEFVTLSNGGFYMMPVLKEPQVTLESENGFRGQLSHEAAGITVCLFAYSHLSFNPRFAHCTNKHFHWLRAYAKQQAEADAIFAAID
jgi:Antirestriction protein